MQIDFYTKVVLTVIAAALAGIAINGLPRATAQGWQCGSGPGFPCHIRVIETVRVKDADGR